MTTEIILHRTPGGEQRIEVAFRNEDFWMTQKDLAELFGGNVPTISKHLKNIFKSGDFAGRNGGFHFRNNHSPWRD